MKVSTLYDLLAPIYGRVVPGMYDLVTSRAAQRLLAGAPGTILDVGVGPGHVLTAMKKRNPAAHTVGVDLSMGMLKQARRRLRKSEMTAGLVCADAIRLPFADGAFEGVVASFLLGLFPPEDIPGALKEMGRVLAPGGRIVVATLQISNPALRYIWLTLYKVLPPAVGFVRPIDFSTYLDGSGLRLLQDEEIPQAAGTRLMTLVKVVG